MNKEKWCARIQGVSIVVFGVFATVLSVVFQLGRVYYATPGNSLWWLFKWVGVPASLFAIVIPLAFKFSEELWWPQRKGLRLRIVAWLSAHAPHVVVVSWSTFHLCSYAATGFSLFPVVAAVPTWVGVWFVLSLWLTLVAFPIVVLLEFVSDDSFNDAWEDGSTDCEFGKTRILSMIFGVVGAGFLLLWHIAAGTLFTAEFPLYPPRFHQLFSMLMTICLLGFVGIVATWILEKALENEPILEPEQSKNGLAEKLVDSLGRWLRLAFYSVGLFWLLIQIPGLPWFGKVIVLGLLAVALMVVLRDDEYGKTVFSTPDYWLGVPLVLALLANCICTGWVASVSLAGFSPDACKWFGAIIWVLLLFGGLFIDSYQQPLIPEYRWHHRRGGETVTKTANLRLMSWLFVTLASLTFLSLCIWTELGTPGVIAKIEGQHLLVQVGFFASLGALSLFSAALVLPGLVLMAKRLFLYSISEIG